MGPFTCHVHKIMQIPLLLLFRCIPSENIICESSLIEAVVGVDVVHNGPGEGGVVIAGGEVAGVVGVALVGAGLEAEAGGLPGQGARRTQGPVCPALFES